MKYWYKYKLLIISLIITAIILAIDYLKQDFLGNLTQHFDNATAIALAVLAFMAYWEYAKGEDEIPIKFDVDGEKIDTNIKLLRKQITRGEILGILGMIQKRSDKKFDIKNDAVYKLMKNISEIQKGDKNEVLVEISREDYDKYFNIDNKG